MVTGVDAPSWVGYSHAISRNDGVIGKFGGLVCYLSRHVFEMNVSDVLKGC